MPNFMLVVIALLFPVSGVFSLRDIASVTNAQKVANPINKVLEMISKMQRELIKEGEEAQKLYTEFANMCEDRSMELHQELKNSKAQRVELEAVIEKADADIESLEEKINDMGAAVSDAEDELKKAVAIRKKESTDFAAEEKELKTTISAIDRARSLVEREGAKASLMQVDRARDISSAFQAMVEASGIDTYDVAKLTALVQSSDQGSSSQKDAEDEDDSDEDADAAAYEGQSGPIANTLSRTLRKAEKQLADVRNSEAKASGESELMQQSLKEKIKNSAKEMGNAKTAKVAAAEKKANAEGNLKVTKKDYDETETDLSELHHECLDKATAFEETTSSRGEEMKALTEAKKLIATMTGSAALYDAGHRKTSLASASFLQTASTSDSAGAEARALHVVRRMALTSHSVALIGLASKISKAIRFSETSQRSSSAPKVKDMISRMMSRLETEATSDASKKEYCDTELSESKTSEGDKEDKIEQINTQIDVMTAESKKLKVDVARVKRELGDLARTLAEKNQLRTKEKAIFSEQKLEYEQGLEGMKKALTVLRDYYSKRSPEDGGASLLQEYQSSANGIISMLEVCEADFSKGLSDIMAAEGTAETEYEAGLKESEVVKDTKENEVKFKVSQYVTIDKSVTELKSDESGEKSELDAVIQYIEKLKGGCIAQPDSYEERKQRREEEIAGLKEALDELGESAALLQSGTVHRTLRGAARSQDGKLETSGRA